MAKAQSKKATASKSATINGHASHGDFFSSVSNPVANTNCTVMNTSNRLCRSNGTLTAPDQGTYPGYSLKGIYVTIVPGGSPSTSDSDIFNHPGAFQQVSAPGNWDLSMQIPAYIGAQTFSAVTAITRFDYTTFQYVIALIDRVDIPFNGVAGDCSRIAGGPRTQKVLKAQDSSLLRRRAGRWIHQRIDVSTGSPVKLMDGVDPLSASVIECYVENVAWKHSIVGPDGKMYRTEHVTRALGDLIAASPPPSSSTVSDFRDQYAPQNAVIIWQNDPVRPYLHVVAAESKSQRESVYLQSSKDIWIAPNFDRRSNVYEGGFDLYFRVITP
ncbi:MAG: hypothetical protein JSS49_22945 [Planctomycetes bacterium]|nr:hypothetical protein [Planctomycetota bacterium]